VVDKVRVKNVGGSASGDDCERWPPTSIGRDKAKVVVKELAKKRKRGDRGTEMAIAGAVAVEYAK
jgi:hypothetical protein